MGALIQKRRNPKTDEKNFRRTCISKSTTTHGRSESFVTLDLGVPKFESIDEKLLWFRSQIVGGEADFISPFGKRRITYGDHTASGRCLHYIENFIINNVLPFYGNSHTSDSYVGHRTTKMVQEATSYIKECLGGRQDDAILFCGSGTTSAIKKLQEVMGITVPSILRERVLEILKPQERWVVFVGPYEHHSNLLSWRQSLAEVVEIGLDENGLIDQEGLREKLEFYRCSDRPMLGSFSACSNVSGIYSDVEGIARVLHQFGAFACFDYAASGPYVNIDMRSGEIEGCDAIFLSPHKFLGGPGTPGILLMNKALYQLRTCPPSTCGGGTVSYVNGFNEKDTLYLEEIEERENGGTPQIIQTIRAALTFWVKDYVGYQVIEKLEQIYIENALKRLLPNKNICILGNSTAKRQAILSFLIYSTTDSTEKVDGSEGTKGSFCMWAGTGNKRDKPLHGPFVATILNDLFGIQARGGCACAGPYGHSLLDIGETESLVFRSAIQKGYVGVKPGWTRISFPYYMSNEEFEFILHALEFIAIYGQRFLHLYHFNLRTGNWTFKKKALEEFLGKENSNILRSLPLATSKKAIKKYHKESNERDSSEAKRDRMINEYALYRETAKHIATLLPKVPPTRTLHEDIDNILPFRV